MAAINAYLERLPARMAEYKLAMAEASTVPHMKKNDRKQTLDAWQKAANVFSPQKAKPASPARLKLMGIGVRFVE